MSRSPDFSTRPEEPPRNRLIETAALLIAGLLLAASVAGAVMAFRDREETQATLSSLRTEVQAARERLLALDSQKGGGAAASAQLVWTAEAPPSRLLAELSALMPPDVRLESIGLGYGPRLEIDALVVARRPAAYDLFLERLSESRVFADVLPGSETREGEMRASVRMSYRWLP